MWYFQATDITEGKMLNSDDVLVYDIFTFLLYSEAIV